MTPDEARKVYARLAAALSERGVAVTERTTPADLARAAHAAGYPVVQQFVDDWYCPLLHGEGATRVSDEEALGFVIALEPARVMKSVPGPTVRRAAIARDWPRTFGMLLGAVIAGLTAVGCYQDNSGWGLVLLAGVFTLGGLVAAYNSKKGECPGCGETLPVELGALSQGIGYCFKCQDYARVDGEYLIPVEPGFIANDTDFELRWDAAPPPSAWTWPWRGRCCVCGVAAVQASSALWGTTSVPVETCADHSGVTGMFISAPFVKFRSYDHWRAFREVNEVPRG